MAVRVIASLCIAAASGSKLASNVANPVMAFPQASHWCQQHVSSDDSEADDASSPSKPGWTRLANGNKAGGEDNRRRRWMCRGCGGKPRNRYTCAQCHRWFCPQCVEAGAHECLKERAHQPRWDEPQGRIWPCSRTGTLEERIHRFQQELDRYHEGRKRSEQQQQVRSLYCNKCYYAPWAKQSWIAWSKQNGITVWGRKRSEQQQRPACDHQR